MKKALWTVLLAAVILAAACAAFGEAAEETEPAAVPVSVGELVEMMYAPDSAAHVGETIRVEGTFGGVYNEGTEDAYCFLILAAPGACARESIRFIPDAACTAFPEPYTAVVLTGTLVRTETDGQSALRILDAFLSWE